MNTAGSTTGGDGLAQARERLGHSVERLDEVRADLVEIVGSLLLPPSDADIAEPLAGLCELDAVMRCALHDHLDPLIRSLGSLLPGEADA